MSTTVPSILLVEDDPNDAFFLKRALHKVRPDISLTVVTDGEQAIDYLNGRHQYADRATYPFPLVILLDLKLPYLSGFQILEHIRAEAALAQIPVFILTSSPEERDRLRALELGAKRYFIKPPTPEMLVEIIGASAFPQWLDQRGKEIG